MAAESMLQCARGMAHDSQVAKVTVPQQVSVLRFFATTSSSSHALCHANSTPAVGAGAPHGPLRGTVGACRVQPALAWCCSAPSPAHRCEPGVGFQLVYGFDAVSPQSSGASHRLVPGVHRLRAVYRGRQRSWSLLPQFHPKSVPGNCRDLQLRQKRQTGRQYTAGKRGRTTTLRAAWQRYAFFCRIHFFSVSNF